MSRASRQAPRSVESGGSIPPPWFSEVRGVPRQALYARCLRSCSCPDVALRARAQPISHARSGRKSKYGPLRLGRSILTPRVALTPASTAMSTTLPPRFSDESLTVTPTFSLFSHRAPPASQGDGGIVPSTHERSQRSPTLRHGLAEIDAGPLRLLEGWVQAAFVAILAGDPKKMSGSFAMKRPTSSGHAHLGHGSPQLSPRLRDLHVRPRGHGRRASRETSLIATR